MESSGSSVDIIHSILTSLMMFGNTIPTSMNGRGRPEAINPISRMLFRLIVIRKQVTVHRAGMKVVHAAPIVPDTSGPSEAIAIPEL
jgi:hypothetical protein